MNFRSSCFRTLPLLAFALLAMPHPLLLHADNWPQWRGSRLDNVSTESGLPDQIGREHQLWRVELPGPGGASPIVWEDAVFVTSVGPHNELFLIRYSTAGEQVWRQPLEGQNQPVRMDNANSASPSPFTDGKHVWALMTNGILHCFDMDGQLAWKKDLQEAYGEFNIQFGMASTPILDGDRIYLQLIHGDMRDRGETSHGWVIALDANSGDEIWKHERITDGFAENKHAYTSPVLYRDADRAFLITHGGDYAIGHSLEDGAELWRCGGINPQGEGYNPFLRFVASPTCVEGLIALPSAKQGPVFGLNPSQLSGDVTDQESAFLWRRERGTPDVASPLIYDGRVYLAGERERLTCFHAETGEDLFDENRFLASKQRSTPVAGDGKIYLTERDGTVTVLRAGDTFEVLSRLKLEEDTTASPAIANGVVYVRTQNALYAFGRLEKTSR